VLKGQEPGLRAAFSESRLKGAALITRRGAGNRRAIWISGKLVRVLALVCAAGLIGLTTASATSSKTAVRSRITNLGRIIVADSNQHTLYGFGNDGKNKSKCYGKCSRTFVPLWAKGKIVAVKGSRVNAKKLGKFRRRSGSWQVTYYGQPLYLYTGDTRAGQHRAHYRYHFGGSWYAIDINGSPAPPPGYR
jgi:predicted lipoprotein with Yx(FWY)xxD motif